MGYSIDVNSDNYNTEVRENSYTQPVIVDFFATWCGPCQLLKPILEKLLKEYDFILAKIDIDKNPELANHFEVEGVPDVRVVSNGEMMPAFVGAASEAQIRNLLAQFNLKSALDLGLESLSNAMNNQNPLQAKQILDELFSIYPDNPKLILSAAKFLLQIGKPDEAEKMLGFITTENPEFYAQGQKMKTLIELRKIASENSETELDQLFTQAAKAILTEDYEAGLKLFLDIVKTNRKYRNDGARKAMISVFNLLGAQHPLTNQYQQELMMILY